MLDTIGIKNQTLLCTPAELKSALPAHPALLQQIHAHRTNIQRILQGQDDRLLVIVGPCSIHDVDAALEYAELLQHAAKNFSDSLFIVMRTYLEKPRTTLGWKGLISDPKLDGSFDFNLGLHNARELLLKLAEMHVPTATEFLDPIVPHYLGDLISWCAIGARTTESQIHRELASGLPMPVGFKNSTDGNIKIAIDAVSTANHPHHFLSINANGNASVTTTTGNPHCHIILRGSNEQSNFAEHDVALASKMLESENLALRLMIDCSHGNSMKHASNQLLAAQAVTEQIAQGSNSIFGVMLESNLMAGKQKLTTRLHYGQSITDECISWQETLPILSALSEAAVIANAAKQSRR